MTNTLTKPQNQVIIAGVLYEVNPDKTFTGVTKAGVDYISATIAVETSENNVVEVKTFQQAKKADGTANANYATLQKVLNQPTKLADGAETKIRIATSFDANAFVTQDGTMAEGVQISGGFISLDNVRQADSSFKVDMVIRSVEEEMDKEGVETGRAIVKGHIFTFRKMAFPIKFVVDSVEGAKYFLNLDLPTVTKVWGNVVNSNIETEKTIESAFGAPQVIKSSFSRREYVITGASVEPYDIDEATATMIKDGKAAYETFLADVQTRYDARQNSNNAFSAPAPSAPAAAPKAGGFSF